MYFQYSLIRYWLHNYTCTWKPILSITKFCCKYNVTSFSFYINSLLTFSLIVWNNPLFLGLSNTITHCLIKQLELNLHDSVTPNLRLYLLSQWHHASGPVCMVKFSIWKLVHLQPIFKHTSATSRFILSTASCSESGTVSPWGREVVHHRSSHWFACAQN